MGRSGVSWKLYYNLILLSLYILFLFGIWQHCLSSVKLTYTGQERKEQTIADILRIHNGMAYIYGTVTQVGNTDDSNYDTRKIPAFPGVIAQPERMESLSNAGMSKDDTGKPSRISLLSHDDTSRDLIANISLPTRQCPGQERHDFVHMRGGIFVYSAYIDERKTDVDEDEGLKVRVMVLAPNNQTQELGKLTCIFHEGHRQYYTSIHHVHPLQGDESEAYKGFMLTCPLPRGLTVTPCYLYMSHHSAKIALTDNRSSKDVRNFTICLPPLYGSVDPLYFIEFMELVRMLGADHVMMYNRSVTGRDVSYVTSHYRHKHRLSIRDWHLPGVTANLLQEHARALATQDCLYRNMARTKLLAFHDFNEFIMPKNYGKWSDLLHNNLPKDNKYGGYAFSSFSYPVTNQKPGQTFLVTSRNMRRARKRNELLTRTWVLPELVFEQSVNQVSRYISRDLRTHDVHVKHAHVHRYHSNCTETSRFTSHVTVSTCRSLVGDQRVHSFFMPQLERTVRKIAMNVGVPIT